MTDVRILVTGSRDWDDLILLSSGLSRAYDRYSEVGDRVILVSGNCPTGADHLAEMYWRALDLEAELHPADWAKHGKRAGFVRNAEMVDLGADVCVAFIKNASKGATMTADLAEKKGIPTWRYYA